MGPAGSQHEALAEQMKTAQSRHAELAEPTELARSRREALAEPTSSALSSRERRPSVERARSKRKALTGLIQG